MKWLNPTMRGVHNSVFCPNEFNVQHVLKDEAAVCIISSQWCDRRQRKQLSVWSSDFAAECEHKEDQKRAGGMPLPKRRLQEVGIFHLLPCMFWNLIRAIRNVHLKKALNLKIKALPTTAVLSIQICLVWVCLSYWNICCTAGRYGQNQLPQDGWFHFFIIYITIWCIFCEFHEKMSIQNSHMPHDNHLFIILRI